MMTGWIYFTTEYAIAEHDWIIENSGGMPGTKDVGTIDSVLEHIQNDLYYPTFEEKLCHIVFLIIKLHAFNDGNKRSSLVLGSYFLEINGYEYCVNSFTQRMENIVVWVAEGLITKELLQKLITSILIDDEFSESLKLELLEAVNK